MDLQRMKRMLVSSRVIFLLLLIPLCQKLHAQRYPFHNLNVDDGLIQSQATCITQDKTGNLWIGTLGGLSRFDGTNFTGYTIRNGLPNNSVWSVAADDLGNIWVGTNTSISVFNGKSFTHFNRQQSQYTKYLRDYLQQIQVCGDTTWWRVAGDIYFITKGKIKYFVTPGSQGYVTAMRKEKGGIWIAKEKVIYHIAGSRTDSFVCGTEVENENLKVYHLYRSNERVLWVGTNKGLFRINDGKTIMKVPVGDSLAVQPAISCIVQDRSGTLWMSTNKGVIKMSGSAFQYYNKRNGLSDNNFFHLFADIEGNVWMASDGQGVFRYSGTQFTSLDETMGLPSAQIMGIASNLHDSLFLGTYDAGLFVFKEGKVSALPFPSSPVPAITSLCYTRKSKLWIGTRGSGLWSFEHGIFRQYAAPERGFPSNFVNSLYEDAMGRLWIGFANGALLLEHDSFKTLSVENARVYSFLTIGKDSTLLCTEGGLQLYSGGILSDFKTRTKVDSFSIQCFTLLNRNLWMGSPDNGVICYNLDTRKTIVINKNNGLRSDFIYNIVADDEGNIWVGTGFGINKITINGNNEPKITLYGKAQGITGMESNINAVLKLPDSSIWFGTTNGAMHYQPRSARVLSEPVNIVLQSLKLTGETAIDKSYFDSMDVWYGIPYHLLLPPKKNSLTFVFQAVTMSGMQVMYRYRMEGLDVSWSDWSATNSVSYSALPPGKYVFIVQCLCNGTVSEKELKYSFEIITPFQKTKWFRYTVLGACILLGIGLQYMFNSRKQRRLRLLAKLRSEEQAKVRLRTAEDFHDEIGNKLTRINVLASVLRNKITLNAESQRILDQIEDNTSQLYGGTRDILWSLKPSNDNLYEILHRIKEFGDELFMDTEVQFSFSGTDEKWRKYKLPMDMSRNLIMIFKEALNNCLKYAEAKNVSLNVSIRNRNVLQLVLTDDGKGFDVQSVKKGNGLNNMQIRTERLKGKIYVDSRPQKGTIISLTFKVPQDGN